MKKFFVTFLMLLYLIPAIGVNLTQHYCGGNLAFVSHKFSEKKTCVCGPKKMKKGCCEEKHQSFKIDDSQLKAHSIVSDFTGFSPADITTSHSFPIEINLLGYVSEISDTSLHPPNLYKRPIYILNRTLRI